MSVDIIRAMAKTTETATPSVVPTVAPIIHRHDKALNDAMSAQGRFVKKLKNAGALKRLTVNENKNKWSSLTDGDLDGLTTEEIKQYKAIGRVITAYNALDSAIAALKK